MSPYLSRKIKVLSFLSIVVVLYIHTSYAPEELPATNLFIQRSIAGVWGRIAVPMFFCISGFLFFQRVDSLSDVLVKLKKRIRTVFIPYVIAASVYVLFFAIMESIPGISRFQNESLFKDFDFTVLGLFKNTFLSSKELFSGELWAYHLWFLRDLLLILATTPLIFLAFRKGSLFLMAATSMALYFVFGVEWFSSLFWFYLGYPLFNSLEKNTLIGKGFVIIALWCVFAALSITDIFMSVYPKPLYYYVDIVTALTGVAVVWLTYNVLIKNKERTKALPDYMSYTFFVYLYHAPAVTILHKLYVFLFGANMIGYGMGYIFTPPSCTQSYMLSDVFLNRDGSFIV